MSGSDRTRREIDRLRRAAPRSRMLRSSAWGLAGLAALAWLGGTVEVQDLLTERRLTNLQRFLATEAMPFPLRKEGFSVGGLLHWVQDVWSSGGGSATWATLCIALVAITMAGAIGACAAPIAARTLMSRRPYASEVSSRGKPWTAASGLTRLGLAVARSTPEYLLAFFLVAMLPVSPWPAILALSLHNAGILGKLYGDTTENLDAQPLRALRHLGASRRQLALLAAFPMGLSRYLLYLFYRFETCIREATVLGMLGVVSLGYQIGEARSRHFYDEMLLLVAFGVVIVLASDLTSHLARGWIRRSS